MKKAYYSSEWVSIIVLAVSAQGCLNPLLRTSPKNTTTSSSTSLTTGASKFTGLKHFGSITKPTGATGNDIGRGAAVDSSGNIYIALETAGAFGETVGGCNDAVVMKMDSSGSVLWIKQLGSVSMPGASSGCDQVASIGLDPSGNPVIAGSTGGSLGEASAGGYDPWVAKLNASNGALLWIRQLGNVTVGAAANGMENVYGVVVAPVSGNIYLTAHTNGSIGEANAGGLDVMIAKLNPTGTVAWIRQMGTSFGAATSAGDTPRAIAIDSSENVYVTGETFGALGEANAGSSDAFLVKYNTSGTHQWTRQLGNVTVGATASAVDGGKGVAINSAGEIFVTGTTSGNLVEASAGVTDIFLAKYDNTGTLIWLRHFGATSLASGTGAETPSDLLLDSTGNVLISGATRSNLAETNGGGGNDDLFLLKASGSTGAILSVRQLGQVTAGAGANMAEYNYHMAVDSADKCYLPGYTQGNLGELLAGGQDLILWVL